jgi:hypothetical protein
LAREKVLTTAYHRHHVRGPDVLAAVYSAGRMS